MEQELEKITDQLQYKQKILSSPYYKYQKLPPQSAASVQISATGGNDTVFECPVKVFNLSRSWLEFVLNPTAAPALNYNYMHLGVLSPWQQIQVISKTTGKILLDISNFQMFSKLMFQAEVTQEEFNNQDTGFDSNSIVSFLRPNLSPNLAATPTISFTVKGQFGLRAADGSLPAVYFKEASYCELGTVATATPIFTCKVPLGLIKESILEVDKDLFFNDVLQIRFVWGAHYKVGWMSTSATDPTNGATPVALAGPINVSSLSLYLAVEQNEAIANEIKNTVLTQGLRIPIAYPTSIRNVITNNTQHTVTILMNQTHGTRLLKIYHTMLTLNGGSNPTEQYYTAYNISLASNVYANGSYFYCQLDSNRIEDQNVNLSMLEDWMYIQSKLKNSITYDSGVYRENWFWVEDFSTIDSIASNINENDIRGIDMGNGRRFDFQLNCAGGAVSAIHYDFVIGQKMLVLTSNGPTLE